MPTAAATTSPPSSNFSAPASPSIRSQRFWRARVVWAAFTPLPCPGTAGTGSHVGMAPFARGQLTVLERRCGFWGADDFAVVELDDAIGNVEIFFVVRDHEHGFAARFEFGQQLGVENVLEVRVLVGGPFVEEIKWPVFQIRREKCKPL